MMKKIIGLEGKEVMNFAATNMKKNLARAQRKRDKEGAVAVLNMGVGENVSNSV